MQATRERKERFILSFGKINGQTGNDAVSSLLHNHGLEAFTDWAIDEMASDQVRWARFVTRELVRSRNLNRRILASSAVDGEAA